MTWPDGVPGLVELPSGRRVVGTAAGRLAALAPGPQLVVRLDRDEVGPWRTCRIDWPDFRTPRDTPAALGVLREAYAASADERVAIACLGGRGRTGTALALLAVLDGVPGEEAVAWVRAHYLREAVETRAQARWVRRAADLLGC